MSKLSNLIGCSVRVNVDGIAGHYEGTLLLLDGHLLVLGNTKFVGGGSCPTPLSHCSGNKWDRHVVTDEIVFNTMSAAFRSFQPLVEVNPKV